MDHRTSETTKLLLLQGLAQSEIEKLQVNTANAEAKRMSYRGASVGVGHIMGVTFPLAGVTFGRLKLDYQRLASNDDSMTPSIEPVSYTPAPDPKVMEV